MHAVEDTSLYGDNILGIDLVEFFLLALAFIRMPEIDLTGALGKKENFILKKMLVSGGLFTGEKVGATEEQVFANIIVLYGVIVGLFADVPTNIVEFIFHYLFPSF